MFFVTQDLIFDLPKSSIWDKAHMHSTPHFFLGLFLNCTRITISKELTSHTSPYLTTGHLGLKSRLHKKEALIANMHSNTFQLST